MSMDFLSFFFYQLSAENPVIHGGDAERSPLSASLVLRTY